MAFQKKEPDLKAISIEDRKVIGQAIIDGLISPTAVTFERLATEGGDYDQGDGGYNQTGGGGHDQGTGDYNQSALVNPNQLNISTLANIVRVRRQG